MSRRWRMHLKLDHYRMLAWQLDGELWMKLVRGTGITLDDLRELERFIEFDGPRVGDLRPEANDHADSLLDDLVLALSEGTIEDQAVAAEFVLVGGRFGRDGLAAQSKNLELVWGTNRRPDPWGWKQDPEALKLHEKNEWLLQEGLKRNKGHSVHSRKNNL